MLEHIVEAQEQIVRQKTEEVERAVKELEEAKRVLGNLWKAQKTLGGK